MKLDVIDSDTQHEECCVSGGNDTTKGVSLQETYSSEVHAILHTLKSSSINSFPQQQAINASQEILIALDIESKEPIKEKPLKFIHIPENFSDKLGEQSLSRFLRNISPASLEKFGLRCVVGSIALGGIFVALNYGIAPLLSMLGSKGLKNILHSLVGYTEISGVILVNHVFLWTIFSLALFGSIGLLMLKKGCSLNVGRYGKIILDYTTHTIQFHSQRNLEKIRSRFTLSADIKSIIKEVVDNLYKSGRINEFNILELESHLLVHEKGFERLLCDIKEDLPIGSEIIEMPIRPMESSIKWGVRFLIAGGWKSLIPFLKKKKIPKKTEAENTRGIRIKLPREKSNTDI